MQDFPETPEAVALSLMNFILGLRQAKACCAEPTRAEVLDLYVECLRAAHGCRDLSHMQVTH